MTTTGVALFPAVVGVSLQIKHSHVTFKCDPDSIKVIHEKFIGSAHIFTFYPLIFMSIFMPPFRFAGIPMNFLVIQLSLKM